jgi:hypothetical protein
MAGDERQFLAAVDRVFARLGRGKDDLFGSVPRSSSTDTPASAARITRLCGAMPDSRLATSSTGRLAFTTMWAGLKK